MPTQTGVWSQEEANTGHVFDYNLAKWLGQYFQKDVPLIDMGCGPATYLRYFHDIGFKNLIGVEGTALRQSEFGNVFIGDLTQNIDLGRKGNVMCLEVAEHIPEEYMDQFLNNLVNHLPENPYDDRCLVLSWGIPGQGGLGHVNCRHNIWVVDHMRKKYGLSLDVEDSLMARAMVSNHAHWFRDTLMVFKYLPS